METLDLPSSSKEDIAVGLFLGTIYHELNNQCMNVYNRPPYSEEIRSYYLILKRRTHEIKKKIKELGFVSIIKDTEDDLKEQAPRNLKSPYYLKMNLKPFMKRCLR